METSEAADTAEVSPPDSSKPLRKPLRRLDSMDVEASRVDGMPVSWGDRKLSTRKILLLAFQSIGVVYGDVGTSPLYVYASTFVLNQTDSSGNTIPALEDDILGTLSLIIYTITLIPLIKYCFIVLKANDEGQGGTFALYSLICRHARISLATNQGPEDRNLSSYQLDLQKARPARRAAAAKDFLERNRFMQNLLLIVALVGTCCVIGDGVLTPSISVLSAISGLKVNAPTLSQDVVVWVSVVILFLLFCFQRFGTDKVGYTFAPCICIWFACIALIGVYNIVKWDPSVFKAFNPYYIYQFFKNNKMNGWISLGGIVLAITGTEAMFADLGHFAVSSIQLSFTFVVYPCLLLAYIGQAAFIIKHPDLVSVTFYKSIPTPVYWPMFVVATAAAVIASQAMISAVFSIVDQSMALGCFPRCKVIHTSGKYEGQIYIPEINWILMILCIIVTLALRNTTNIGNAYGIAVVAVMSVTTVFLTVIMIMVWQTRLWLALSFLVCFGSLEIVYFSSTLYKVPQFGWLPLVFVVAFITLMGTWYYGRKEAYQYEVNHKLSLDWLNNLGPKLDTRIPGVGLVYTELNQGVPAIFQHLVENSAIHSTLVFVTVKRLLVPHVSQEERILLRRVGPPIHSMYKCAVRYGYKDPQDGTEFEELLMTAIVEFIQAEALGKLCVNESHNNSSASGLSIDHTIPMSGEIDHNPSFVTGGSTLNGQAAKMAEDSEHDVINRLNSSRRNGVVYILGHTELRASPDSNFFRKFLIDVFYNFLRRNFRSSLHTLNIPHTRLLQVGMVHYI